MVGPLLLWLLTPAFAQDSPWGDLLGDDTEEEAPADDEESGSPWGDLLDEEGGEEGDTEDAPPPVDDAPGPATNPPAPVADDPPPPPPPAEDVLATPTRSAPKTGIEAMPAEGLRIAAIGTGHRVGLSSAAVVGGDGGTNMITVGTRWGAENWSIGAKLPFSAFTAPGQRTTGLGNLRLDGWYLIDTNTLLHGIGVEATLPTGGGAYTWVNQADQLWPGGGVDVVWQARTQGRSTTLMYRGALGLHGASDFEPYPPLFFRINGAVGIDQAITDWFGLVGEASMAWWDMSPFETTALVRVEPLTGLRARTGIVLPLFVWADWDPSARPAGVREATWVLDVTFSL